MKGVGGMLEARIKNPRKLEPLWVCFSISRRLGALRQNLVCLKVTTHPFSQKIELGLKLTMARLIKVKNTGIVEE